MFILLHIAHYSMWVGDPIKVPFSDLNRILDGEGLYPFEYIIYDGS